MPGPAELAHVVLDGERADEHDQEADARRDRAGREREDHQQQAGDEPDDRPLDHPRRVPVERGVGDLLHQLGVGGREVLLDLLQDPLFVLGERHAPIPCPGLRAEAPDYASGHSRARP